MQKFLDTSHFSRPVNFYEKFSLLVDTLVLLPNKVASERQFQLAYNFVVSAFRETLASIITSECTTWKVVCTFIVKLFVICSF